MAGTDSTRGQAETVVTKAAPKMLLVKPQLAENIGMVARAMLNCGLTELRIVEPRESHLAEKALSSCAGANVVLEDANLYETTRKAVADANFVIATTARRRDQVKPVMTPKRAAAEIRARINRGEKVVVMFGAERTGLDNDDVSIADAICEVPLNPAYCSLNLAQAVLLMSYEWFQTGVDVPEYELQVNDTVPATKDEVLNLYAHLERELDLCGFLRVEEKRPTMMRNLRNLFNRSHLNDQDVRTLHGVITELAHGNIKRARRLGIDVSKVREVPKPLYTSQPLFDSSFADSLNELLLADNTGRIMTEDPVSEDAIDQILEVATAQLSKDLSSELQILKIEAGAYPQLVVAGTSDRGERVVGAALQTLTLLARARGLHVEEIEGAVPDLPYGLTAVAVVRIGVPEAPAVNPDEMVQKF